MKSLVRLVGLSLVLGACGQHQGTLQGGSGDLQVPATLDFGQVYLGASVQQSLPVKNGGDAQLTLNVALTGDSRLLLVSPPSFTLAEGAGASVVVALQATSLGAVQATLAISGDATAQVQVTAAVVADLVCPATGACNVQTFDPSQGSCVGSTSPDGTPCDDGDECTTSDSCTGGVCKGTPVTCNDDNVCTTDYCDPTQGCVYQDNSARCQGQNPCEVYYCDPVQGCLSSPAANGTPCDAVVQCIQADVCLNGQCTGVPLPDGTKCVDPIDPCATDATCSSGVCDSPTADALKPGDVLWKVVAAELAEGDGGELPYDAGSGSGPLGFGWRGPAATDDLGNIYVDDLGDAGAILVSLDVCGNERWRSSSGASSINDSNGRHVLTNGVVISWMADNTLVGQSEADGSLLWSFSPAQAGFDISQLPGFSFGDVALSNDGILYYTGAWSGSDGDGGIMVYGMIGALLSNGQSRFAVALPPVDMGPAGGGFGYPLLVDENSNLYTTLNDYGGAGSANIVSYDQTGALRWALPVSRVGLDSLSENQGVFLEPTSLTSFNANGDVLWQNTEGPAVVQASGHSPVVASDGTTSLERYRFYPDGGGYGVIEDYGTGGTLLWSFDLSEGESAPTSEVLDQNGILYFGSSRMRIFAIDAASGALVWQTELSSEGPMYGGVLDLTPAGSLIASTSRELFSIYAGAPMASSPWPRFRGDNDNRSCPARGGATSTSP